MCNLYPDTARQPEWTQREDYCVLRSDVTGAGNYRFLQNHRQLATGKAPVLPDWPLVLNFGAMVLNSSFDRGRTIFPGCSRDVIDADNAADPLAKLIYRDTGHFELQVNLAAGQVCLQILSQERSHLFLRDGNPIARIAPPAEAHCREGWEMHYCMESREVLSDELALMMLSYPLLRFAL